MKQKVLDDELANQQVITARPEPRFMVITVFEIFQSKLKSRVHPLRTVNVCVNGNLDQSVAVKAVCACAHTHTVERSVTLGNFCTVC